MHYRSDLELWSDEYFVEQHGLKKRKTFGHPAYYLGKKMFSFVYDDGIVIKQDPKKVQDLLGSNPERYKPFNPGDGPMKNWVLIVRTEDFEYEEEQELMEDGMEQMV